MDSPYDRPTPEGIARRRRDLRSASVSDIHFGHPSTPTRLIAQNLREAFPQGAVTGELDIIYIVGDIFDEALDYADTEEIGEIERWFHYMLRLAELFNIVIIVLAGTPSHDRGQPKHFEKIWREGGYKVDFRYITEISIIHVESLDIRLLCVPDFTSPDGEAIYRRVLEVFAEHGLTSVDYGLIHGAFSYQMPDIPAVQAGCHRMERYHDLVDNTIWAGHIHESSVWGRIHSNGSFDRLNHGEEHAKGHWRALHRVNGEDDYRFVINTGAKRYDSVNVSGLPMDEALARVTQCAQGLPELSNIRIVGEREHPIFTNIRPLKEAYPKLQWSTKVEKKQEAPKALLSDMRPVFEEIAISKETIAQLLMDRILPQITSASLIERCRKTIAECSR